MISEGTPRRDAGSLPTGGRIAPMASVVHLSDGPAGAARIQSRSLRVLPFGLRASGPHVANAQDRDFAFGANRGLRRNPSPRATAFLSSASPGREGAGCSRPSRRF